MGTYTFTYCTDEVTSHLRLNMTSPCACTEPEVRRSHRDGLLTVTRHIPDSYDVHKLVLRGVRSLRGRQTSECMSGRCWYVYSVSLSMETGMLTSTTCPSFDQFALPSHYAHPEDVRAVMRSHGCR